MQFGVRALKNPEGAERIWFPLCGHGAEWRHSVPEAAARGPADFPVEFNGGAETRNSPGITGMLDWPRVGSLALPGPCAAQR